MRPKTVLIVDDDTALRDSLADILWDEGYEPVTAGTCADALQIARQKRPGAAFLDLKLPDGAGTTLLAELKRLDPECICTIVTAYADLDSAVSALEKGAYQYLKKPVRPLEMLNLLEKIFDIIDLRIAKYQAEEKLRESENRFRAIFETAEDAIFMKDRDRKFVLINPKAESFLGFSVSALIGHTAEEFYDEDNAKRVRTSDTRVLEGETVEEDCARLVDGVTLTYHVIGVPMYDTSGQVSGICSIARDITDKLRMEAQLAQAQKMEAIGTKFRVYWPRIESEITQSEPKVSPKPFPEGRECILFVDDETSLTNIGEQILKKLGYEVIAKTDPREALEVFREQSDKIDLVVTDQTMPHMTGDKLARHILELKPGIPVIICSGFSDMMNKKKAKSLGIRKFIMKPLEMRELAETIRRILDESQITSTQ